MILYYLMTFTEALLGVVGIRSLYEQPPYMVVERLAPTGGPAIEVRDYPARLAAESDDDGSGSEAFGRLFQYITGANATGARVAMTAPVSQAAASQAPVSQAPVSQNPGSGQRIAMTVPVQSAGLGGQPGVMRFFLPRKVAEAGAPRPKDPAVRIVTVPGERVAVLRFSGLPSGERVAQRKQALLAAVAKAGWTARGEPFLLTYDAPFTLPFLRRNEAAVVIAPS